MKTGREDVLSLSLAEDALLEENGLKEDMLFKSTEVRSQAVHVSDTLPDRMA